jgi:formamidopyrimidine-DNA glycosylase
VPEIPDLDAIVSYLESQIVGASILEASLPIPWMLRSVHAPAPEVALRGERIAGITRRGKYLVFSLSAATLVIHPMLAGRFYYGTPQDPVPRDLVVHLLLSNNMVLRYADEKRMGKLYLVPGSDVSSIPGFLEQGPDPLARDFTFEVFLGRLQGRYGEIKGLLTNAKVISGIGSAYADEILFEAGIYPFRRKKDLSEAELRRLYEAISTVLRRAKAIVAERMGAQIHLKIRDFLQVHGKSGKSCPRCGQRIASVGGWERATQFCRHCQPGLMTDEVPAKPRKPVVG